MLITRRGNYVISYYIANIGKFTEFWWWLITLLFFFIGHLTNLSSTLILLLPLLVIALFAAQAWGYYFIVKTNISLAYKVLSIIALALAILSLAI